jgi:hypothetical protein
MVGVERQVSLPRILEPLDEVVPANVGNVENLVGRSVVADLARACVLRRKRVLRMPIATPA